MAMAEHRIHERLSIDDSWEAVKDFRLTRHDGGGSKWQQTDDVVRSDKCVHFGRRVHVTGRPSHAPSNEILSVVILV